MWTKYLRKYSIVHSGVWACVHRKNSDDRKEQGDKVKGNIGREVFSDFPFYLLVFFSDFILCIVSEIFYVIADMNSFDCCYGLDKCPPKAHV